MRVGLAINHIKSTFGSCWYAVRNLLTPTGRLRPIPVLNHDIPLMDSHETEYNPFIGIWEEKQTLIELPIL